VNVPTPLPAFRDLRSATRIFEFIRTPGLLVSQPRKSSDCCWKLTGSGKWDVEDMMRGETKKKKKKRKRKKVGTEGTGLKNYIQSNKMLPGTSRTRCEQNRRESEQKRCTMEKWKEVNTSWARS
jgi:hypothetical protein